MKLRKINLLLALSFGAIIALTGCGKDDGPTPNRVPIEQVPVINTLIDASGSQSINLLNLAVFSGKFRVENYFPGGLVPDKMDIVVRKTNGGTVTNANVRVFKAGVTTLPSSFTVTVADIVAIFGPITLGDNYDFAPDMYVGTKKYEAFPAVGTGTGAGVIGMPLFKEFARFSALCAYDPTIYEGNFVVVSDAFGDFVPGQVVLFTKTSNTTFTFLNPYVTSPLPITVTVNPLNNQVTITKQKIGNAFTWNLNYTNPNFSVTAGATSFVSPCSKTINMDIGITVDQGSFGNKLLVLRKQ